MALGVESVALVIFTRSVWDLTTKHRIAEWEGTIKKKVRCAWKQEKTEVKRKVEKEKQDCRFFRIRLQFVLPVLKIRIKPGPEVDALNFSTLSVLVCNEVSVLSVCRKVCLKVCVGSSRVFIFCYSKSWDRKHHRKDLTLCSLTTLLCLIGFHILYIYIYVGACYGSSPWAELKSRPHVEIL